MTLRYLLDANVLSEPTRPRGESSIAERLTAAEGRTAMAAVVWQELCYGVARLPMGRRRDALLEWVRALPATHPILPYDERAADWHAVERARLEAAGVSRPVIDGQIAATAAVRGLVLVTRNIRDFAGYTDLEVESWWPDPVP